MGVGQKISDKTDNVVYEALDGASTGAKIGGISGVVLAACVTSCFLPAMAMTGLVCAAGGSGVGMAAGAVKGVFSSGDNSEIPIGAPPPGVMMANMSPGATGAMPSPKTPSMADASVGRSV
jgi:hypothetical protein